MEDTIIAIIGLAIQITGFVYITHRHQRRKEMRIKDNLMSIERDIRRTNDRKEYLDSLAESMWMAIDQASKPRYEPPIVGVQQISSKDSL
jgi:hypothetical protein